MIKTLQNGQKLAIAESRSDILHSLYEMKKIIQEKGSINPPERVYEALVRFTSTEPRDRIFAILSLVTKHPSGCCIIPNYKASVRDVFTHAMSWMIVNTSDFALFGRTEVGFPRSTYNGRTLPS